MSEADSKGVFSGEEDRPSFEEEIREDQRVIILCIADRYFAMDRPEKGRLISSISKPTDFELLSRNDLGKVGLYRPTMVNRVLVYCRWLDIQLQEDESFGEGDNPEDELLSVSATELRKWGRKFTLEHGIQALDEPVSVPITSAEQTKDPHARTEVTELKDGEFALKFKGMSEAPTFDGKVESFNTFNRDLHAWLGLYHLEVLIGDDRQKVKRQYPRRNNWFHSALILMCPGDSNPARVTIEKLCNDDGDLIIDGQKAYHALLEQYGGPDTRELLVDRAREKIRRARLEPTGDLGTHLAVLCLHHP